MTTVTPVKELKNGNKLVFIQTQTGDVLRELIT
jgi:hypothetical protein